METDDRAKDFGNLMLIMGQKEYSFIPFRMYHLVVVSEGSYTTTSNMPWGDEYYAVTLDFDQRILNQLLRLLPDRMSTPLQHAIEHQVKPPTMINLPSPIDIAIDTKLGEPTGNIHENFVPFVVVEMLAAEPRTDLATEPKD